MNEESYQRLLLTSWINIGAFLNQDGSQDGDINTLQCQKRCEYSNPADIERNTKMLRDTITIPEKTPDPNDILRAPTHKPVPYDLAAAEVISKVHELPSTLYELRVQAECQELNAAMIEQWREDMEQDLSNIANRRPTATYMCTPLDIECLQTVVTDLYGLEEAIRMTTDTLGVNWRSKRTGRVIRRRSRNPTIDWQTMTLPIDTTIEHTALRDEILRSIGCTYFHLGPFPDYTAWDAPTVTAMDQIQIEGRARSMNPSMANPTLALEARGIVGYTALKPAEQVTAHHVNSLNWARQRGWTRGRCPFPYSKLAIVFQRHCEQNGAFFRVPGTPKLIDF